MDPSVCGDLWIQALTYFRDLSPLSSETYLKRALAEISEEKTGNKAVPGKAEPKKEDILSPLLVLEILQSKPSLKFSVIKNYLLQRLEVQDRVIRKNNALVETNMTKIKTLRQEVQDLKCTAKNFNPKKCDGCQQLLSLPTIHFMCGHTYHDQCIEADDGKDGGKRHCATCHSSFKDILDRKEAYISGAKDPQQFYRSLAENSKKFQVVAQYLGRGLFSDLNKLEE